MNELQQEGYSFEVWEYQVKDHDSWARLRSGHKLEPNFAIDVVKI